jgi:hypothetical protein
MNATVSFPLWIIAAVLIASIGVDIASIGDTREPLTKWDALFSLGVNAAGLLLMFIFRDKPQDGAP